MNEPINVPITDWFKNYVAYYEPKATVEKAEILGYTLNITFINRDGSKGVLSLELPKCRA